MKKVTDVDFKGERVLMRVDFNVPLTDKLEVRDDTRLRAAVPTINKVLNDGGAVILMSHLGRPKNGPEDKFSMRHVVKPLEELLDTKVKFVDDCIGEKVADAAAALSMGEVLLLENLRFHKEETAGDKDFAKELASLADIYVNDAFGTAHRAHASTAIVAEYFDTKVCGMVMSAELENAEKVMGNAERPYVAIMGGAKISDKILIIEKLLDKVDTLIIGGGMSYTFFKAKGGQIGSSLVEEDKVPLAKELMEKAKSKGVNLLLPQDSIVADKFAADANTKVADNDSIEPGWMGLDIGPKAMEKFEKEIIGSKTVLWNGPMGVFEMEAFAQGTKTVAKAVVKATEAGAFSLIGGGDSAAAINQMGMGDKVSFVSTGGGALLEYMEGKKLPGVAALQ